MGKFDGRGDSLNLKSDKGGEPSSLISRVKHLLRHWGKADQLLKMEQSV